MCWVLCIWLSLNDFTVTNSSFFSSWSRCNCCVNNYPPHIHILIIGSDFKIEISLLRLHDPWSSTALWWTWWSPATWENRLKVDLCDLLKWPSESTKNLWFQLSFTVYHLNRLLCKLPRRVECYHNRGVIIFINHTFLFSLIYFPEFGISKK
jgi:hypothetical protein